jgi:hypothetical protein
VSHRGILVAVLVYVALDLSLPGMPGAFVFDTADSVESAQGGAARRAGALLATPAAAAQTPAMHRQVPVRPPRALVPAATGDHVLPRLASRLARGAADAAPAASEDPH